MATGNGPSWCATEVRRHDPDRWLCDLFAPDSRREALFALHAFNIEIARTREQVSEEIPGLIRLQWWRETLDGIFRGEERGHAVVAPLADAIREHGLSRALLDRMIDAREFDMGDRPPASLAALGDYADATSGSLVLLGLEVLGVRDRNAERAGREVGIAWALCGLLRAAAFHAGHGRQYLPADLMAEAGAREADLISGRGGPAIARVAERVAGAARDRLVAARQIAVGPAALPVLLPGTLADRYLALMARRRYELLARPVRIARPVRQWALLRAAARGRF